MLPQGDISIVFLIGSNLSYPIKGPLKSERLFVHNVLLVGSPGAGKRLLARAMPGILPEMSIGELLDLTRIYSVADQLPAGTPLIRHRPFHAPHHTIYHAGLVGGSNIPKPVSRISNPRTLSATPTCVWGRSGSSAGCQRTVRASCGWR